MPALVPPGSASGANLAVPVDFRTLVIAVTSGRTTAIATGLTGVLTPSPGLKTSPRLAPGGFPSNVNPTAKSTSRSTTVKVTHG